MRTRASIAAWGLFSLTLACFATILILGRNGPGDGDGEPDQIAALIVYALVILSFATVGAVVASRVPENPIGWLCIAMALVPAVAGLGDEYVQFSLRAENHLPGIGYVAATQSLWNAFMTLPALVLLLFPTGRPPGPRWRAVVYALILGLALVLVFDLLKPATDYEGLRNPLGVESISRIASPAEDLGTSLILISVLFSFASLVFRFRRARTEERQQLKLLAYSLVVIVAGILVGVAFEASGRQEASNAAISGSLLSIPLSIGFAVLKHRLYDIDVIINRTIVYAALTAILGGAYLGLVFGLQTLLAPFTSESDLAVAGSTLAVAALFSPIRRIVQAFIDRRFYRRRFDAQRTLDEFNSKLRDQVDLGELSSQLESVVQDTMQPAHVSLWLRPDPGSSS